MLQSLRDNFSDADGNVTIAANTPTGLTRLPIPSVSRIRYRVNVSPIVHSYGNGKRT
jgi:hypothetical protein